jgi:hypothetical protein
LSGLIYIENNKSNEYVSLPRQFLGEQEKVQLTISPRDEKSLSQIYTTKLVFPARMRAYTSIGISFYGANRYDETYNLIKTPVTDSTATYRIEYGDYEKGEIGITALLRHGGKFSEQSNFGVHGTIGAGMSISHKVKPRLMLGGGVTYGTKHMISIDGGIITGFYNKINRDLLSTEHNEIPTDILYSRLCFGVFGSIGYIYQF